MKFATYSTSVTTTGAAGSATGSATLNVTAPGFLEWIYIDYHASTPNTADVTIAHAGTPAAGTIMVRSNSTTDGLFYPRAPGSDAAAAAITDSHTKHVVAGPLTVSVAQGDALTAAVVVTVGVSG